MRALQLVQARVALENDPYRFLKALPKSFDVEGDHFKQVHLEPNTEGAVGGIWKLHYATKEYPSGAQLIFNALYYPGSGNVTFALLAYKNGGYKMAYQGQRCHPSAFTIEFIKNFISRYIDQANYACARVALEEQQYADPQDLPNEISNGKVRLLKCVSSDDWANYLDYDAVAQHNISAHDIRIGASGVIVGPIKAGWHSVKFPVTRDKFLDKIGEFMHAAYKLPATGWKVLKQ